MAIASEQPSFAAGTIVSESLGLYRRFFARFFSLGLVVYLAANLPFALSTQSGSDTVRALWFVIGAVASLVGFFWLEAAFVAQVDDVRDGKIDTTLVEIFERTRDRLPYVAGAGLLIGLAIGGFAALAVLITGIVGVVWLGVVAAVAFGLFLATRWMLAAPIVVLESSGAVDALRRSNGLIRGRSWRAFSLIVVTSLIAGVASGIIRGVLGALLSGFLRVWLVSSIGSALTAPFIAVAWTLAYFSLRQELPAE